MIWNWINLKLHLKQNSLEFIWNGVRLPDQAVTTWTGETVESGETGETGEKGEMSETTATKNDTLTNRALLQFS